MSSNIHATAIKIKNKGVLFIGKSGSGKSDLSLRLIVENKAKIIADDRVIVRNIREKLIASAPINLRGLMEVRGIGIVNLDFISEAQIDLVVGLTLDKIERLPENKYYSIENLKLPFIELNPFEASASAKLLTAISLL
ncbi:MAG: hypothetical protein E7020_04955 [Alphaproteobacteria bacterium]|nr:hypothetical protein [Alphaproteobacteria bacterium]